MLGFLFSTLLKAAEEEVQAGLTGSQALAAAALVCVFMVMHHTNIHELLSSSHLGKVLVLLESNT